MRPALGLVAAGLLLGACSPDTLYDGEEGGPTGPVVTVSQHTVALALEAPERAEITDTVTAAVQVTNPENAPELTSVGITAQLIRPSRGDTVVYTDSVQPSGAGLYVFRIPIDRVATDPRLLPDTVDLRVSAFAVNASGTCVAATGATAQKLACADFSGATIADDTIGAQARTVVTAGQTIQLPSEGRIADAVVNLRGTPRLYLSNQTAHTVDVLDLRNERWNRVQVGSEPWGLALSLDSSTVYVANSGGTSISYVSAPTAPLGAPTETRRLDMPNEALFEVHIVPDTLGLKHYSAFFYDFSDRPEFLAEDAAGRILFSTFPTVKAPTGTIRQLRHDPGWEQAEVRILFTPNAVKDNPNSWSLAHVDSVRVLARETTEDLIEIYDHQPGFPDIVIRSDFRPLLEAIEAIRARGSDIRAVRGNWDLEELGFSDTTYVTASGDRSTVAFGEGAVGPAGRILIWDAGRAVLSNEISVADLVNNASERVSGLGLNHDGSLGVARGAQAAYFFNTDLRLQGMYSQGLAAGAGGATFQPAPLPPALPSPNALAFVGTADRSIKILESDHYRALGEITIRDLITGPLRSAPPLPEDNEGLSCGLPNPDERCVVAKVYGVTSGGGVVVVNVHRYDVQ